MQLMQDFALRNKNRQKLGKLNQNLVEVSDQRLLDRAFLVPNERKRREKIGHIFCQQKMSFSFYGRCFHRCSKIQRRYGIE